MKERKLENGLAPNPIGDFLKLIQDGAELGICCITGATELVQNNYTEVLGGAYEIARTKREANDALRKGKIMPHERVFGVTVDVLGIMQQTEYNLMANNLLFLSNPANYISGKKRL